MTDTGRKNKPGRDHLIPEAALRMYPERHVSNTDWKNLDTYAGYEAWAGDRWAWEFLRRNRFFQRDCDDLNVTLQKKQRPRPKLDPKWMLQAFKCYDEHFSDDAKDISEPKWSVFSRVECWDTNTSLRLGRAPQPLVIEELVLQPGQIALVLDLNGCADLPDLLRLQWSSAWYKMAVSAARLRQAEQKEASKEGKSSTKATSKRVSLPHKDKRIDYLRIADAFSAQYPPSLDEVCEVLHADGRLRKPDAKGNRNTEFSLTLAKNSLYKMIAASRSAIYEQGYLLLLAEEAQKADWKAKIAPHWPISKKLRNAQSDVWGIKDNGPPNPYASLF